MAQRWVEENLDRLPTMYDEYASYPVTIRKALYTKLPFQTRVAFWRTHLDRFTATHDLNPAQAGLVQMVRANISEYLEPDSRVKREAVYANARKVLGAQLAQDAFVNLVPMRFVDSGEACSCSTVHDGCPGEYGCKGDGDGCDPVACGLFGHDTCNGECISPE